MFRIPRCLSCLLCLVLPLSAMGAGDGPKGDAATLAFIPTGEEFHFDTGVLEGTLRAGGQSTGLVPLRHSDTGTTLAGMFGLFSPYRLLTPDARFGSAAWDWGSEAELRSDGAVSVKWLADAEHPLDMTGVYRWTAPNTLDLQLTVIPKQDLRNFEVFLASYFSGFPASYAYVREHPEAEARFVEATKAEGDWQAFPRDGTASALFGDGRWSLQPHPLPWKIMAPLAAPLALRRDPASGLAGVLMARPDDCFGVSMPEGQDFHRSVYLSLFGRDLKAAQEATAHARLVVGKEISDAEAVGLYEAYVGE